MDKFRETIYSAWGAARKALASPNMRRYRAWVFQVYILIALIAFSILALMANIFPYFSLDLIFTRTLQADLPAWLGFVFLAVSWLGYAVQSIALISLVVIFLGMLGLRWEAIVAIIASVCSWTVNTLVKIVIRRPRPSEDLVDVVQSLNSFSFPSGHVMFYTIFFGFLLFLGFTLLRPSWKRRLLILLLSLLILSIGPSRMFLGEHWASDVLGGYLLGSLILILTIQIYHWGKRHLPISQPVAPEDSSPLSAEQIFGDDIRFPPRIPVTSEEGDSDEHHSHRTRSK